MTDAAPWPFVALRDLANEITSGATPQSGSPRYYTEEDGTLFAKIDDLTASDGQHIASTMLHVTDAALRETALKTYPAGTILLSMYGTIGLTKIAARSLSANQALAALVPPFRCDPKFLYHVLVWSRPQWERFKGQTTQANINGAIVRAFRVPNPPLDEQRRIAEILDTMDEQIRKTEQIIAKLKLLRRGLLIDLFTRGLAERRQLGHATRNAKRFVDSQVSVVPMGWEVRPLEQWVRSDAPITYGIVQAGPHIPSGVPYIRTGDMAGDQLSIRGLQRTSASIARAYKRSEVRAGDIVCAIRATVGKVLPVPDELDGANLTQGTARIAPAATLHGPFLLWALRGEAPQRQILMQQKGTTFQEITLRQLRQLLVAAPRSHEEQIAIAKVMGSHEQRCAAEEVFLGKLQKLRSGLREDLLTGAVRVDRRLDKEPA